MHDLNRAVLTNERNKRKREEDDAPATTSFSAWRDNRLLAGYLAHEFLTKGTFFGEQYDPARAAAAPVKPAAKPKELDSRRSYAEVASLFQTKGTHIPGIVNPAELARWIQQ